MGFFFLLVFMVLLFVRPQEFIEAMQGWPILDWVAGLSLAAVFLEGSIKPSRLKRSPLNLFILIFWFLQAFSHIANFWFGGALMAFSGFATVVIIYYLIVLTVNTFTRLRILIWFMIVLSLLLSIQAIMQFHFGEGIFGGEAGTRALASGEVIRQAKGIGIFADPNDLCLNLVVWIPFMLPSVHKGFLSKTSITGIIFMVGVIAGMIYTRSRGGLLALGAVFWMYFYKRTGLVIAVAALLLFASLIVSVPRMGNIDASETSARSRLDHWSVGLNLMKENPLFGVGANRFTEYHYRTAHNSFVLVLAELGFMGGFIWVTIFFTAFREIYLTRNIPNAPPFLNPLLDGLQNALIAWLVAGFFLSQSYKPLSFILLAMVVATLNCLDTQGIYVRHPWGVKQMFLSLAATVGGIIFVHIALRVMWTLS